MLADPVPLSLPQVYANSIPCVEIMVNEAVPSMKTAFQKENYVFSLLITHKVNFSRHKSFLVASDGINTLRKGK